MSSTEERLASTHARSKILVVNDSPDFLTFMREFLSLEGGYEIATLDQSEGVIEQVSMCPPDPVIIDIVFRGGRIGYDIADHLADAAETANIPTLFCTALAERDIPEPVRALLMERAHRILYKPFDVDDLLTHIQEMLPNVSSRSWPAPQSIGASQASTHVPRRPFRKHPADCDAT